MKQQKESFNNSVHSVEYKGYTVHCQYGKYTIAGFGKKAYKSMQAAKDVIDKLDDADNFIPHRKFTK